MAARKPAFGGKQAAPFGAKEDAADKAADKRRGVKEDGPRDRKLDVMIMVGAKPKGKAKAKGGK